MSDLRDNMREWRERKRRMRAKWQTCDRCGTKNPPGERCFNCGYRPLIAEVAPETEGRGR